MAKVKRLGNLVIAAVVVGTFALSSGCTSHPNEEQVRVMEETRSAALSAEQKVQDCNSDKSNKERELSQAQNELDRVKAEKAAMMERLQSWQGE